jgi:hypothetical protein
MSRYQHRARGGESRNFSEIATFEPLESRRLLSATLQPLAAVANPSLIVIGPAPILPVGTNANVQGKSIHAEAGQSFTAVVGTINDPNATVGGLPILDRLRGAIDWGDGSHASAVKFVPQGDGSIAIEGTHTYARVGTDRITIVVTTSNRAPSTTSAGLFMVRIHSAAHVIASPGALTISATAHQNFTALLGSFSSELSSLNMTATIDWGDGTVSTGRIVAEPTAGPSSQGRFAVYGNHTYAKTDSYLVTVTVTAEVGPVVDPTAPPIILVAQFKSVADVLPALAVTPLLA